MSHKPDGAGQNLIARAERVTRPEDIVSHDGSMPPQYPHYRVEPGRPVDLAAVDPGDTGPYQEKDEASDDTHRQRDRLQDLQARLYAENRQSLLIVLQAIDTGGKDGTIKHVFHGVNPQGCRVWSFKQPSTEELEHDFLWRYHLHTPARGMIAIFNRSHYEDVLVVRVKHLVPKPDWQSRYDQINQFERMLTENGTIVIKFLLHISREEQRKRFQARLDTPDKRWKFNVADLADRALWDQYQEAFQEAVNRCSTAYAPWYVIPANHKWYRNLVVARTIADTLAAMNPQYPESTIENSNAIHIPA